MVDGAPGLPGASQAGRLLGQSLSGFIRCLTQLVDGFGQSVRLEALCGSVDRNNADELAARVPDRAADGEEAFFELVIEDGVALLPDLAKLTEKCVPAGDGLRSVRFQLFWQFRCDLFVTLLG